MMNYTNEKLVLNILILLVGTLCSTVPSIQAMISLTDNVTDDINPQISGASIVWQGLDPNADWEIYLDNGSEILQLTDNDSDDTQPHNCHGRVVWRGIDPSGTDTEIFLYVDGQTLQLSDNDNDDEHPVIHHKNVVWQSWDGHDWEIIAYNLVCDCLNQLTNNDFDDVFPQLYQDTVVWQQKDGNDWEIVTSAHELDPPEIELKLTPRTLNLDSKGKWISGKLDFSDVPFSGHDVDLTTIELEGQLNTEKAKVTGNGSKIDVKFDSSALQDLVREMLANGENGMDDDNDMSEDDNGKLKVQLMVTGQLEDGTVFQSRDKIRVIGKVSDDDNGTGQVNVRGLIEEITDNTIMIAGHQFQLTNSTFWLDNNNNEITPDNFNVGDLVEAEGQTQGNATIAKKIKQEDEDGNDDNGAAEVNVRGLIDEITGNTITVAGQLFQVTDSTLWLDNDNNEISPNNFNVGDFVEAEGHTQGNMTIAKKIKQEDENGNDDNGAKEINVRGLIEEISDNSITVAGHQLQLTDSTLWLDNDNNEIPPENFSVLDFVEAEGHTQGNTTTAKKIKHENED